MVGNGQSNGYEERTRCSMTLKRRLLVDTALVEDCLCSGCLPGLGRASELGGGLLVERPVRL